MSPARPRALLLLGAALALLTISAITAASAYWTERGVGSGDAGTRTPQAVTLTPGIAAAQLYPGGRTAVTLTVTNPGSGNVHLGSLTLDLGQGNAGFGVDSSHAGCSTSSLSFTPQTNGGAGWSLAAGGTASITLPASLSMSTDADNACQGARFSVYLTVAP